MKYKIGDKIRIIYMENEPSYGNKIGIIKHIDDIGQLHGTWGSLAVIPGVDSFEIFKGDKNGNN